MPKALPLNARLQLDVVPACSGLTELFFGPEGERPRRRAARESLAKEKCISCELMLKCRELGRRNHEHGVWGGENDEDRALAGFPPRSPSRRSVVFAKHCGEEAVGQVG